MTTEWREGFGGGHESAHWSRHLWDHFRSTRAHVDRMWRAFGIAAKGSPATAEPAYIEYSNPEPGQPGRDWSAIPQAELADAEVNRIDAERERAEQQAAEAEPGPDPEREAGE